MPFDLYGIGSGELGSFGTTDAAPFTLAQGSQMLSGSLNQIVGTPSTSGTTTSGGIGTGEFGLTTPGGTAIMSTNPAKPGSYMGGGSGSNFFTPLIQWLTSIAGGAVFVIIGLILFLMALYMLAVQAGVAPPPQKLAKGVASAVAMA